MQYATENITPVTLELGGKSPNVFFEDVMDQEDEFLDKAIEGLVMFALNSGEVCTAPTRALIHESIYDKFMERAIERGKTSKVGNPLDQEVMMGAQTSNEQQEKILTYIKLGQEEGAELIIGGEVNNVGDDFNKGNYIEPAIFKGSNEMRIFQEEIFGHVLAVAALRAI